jgi:hypothetical protein
MGLAKAGLAAQQGHAERPPLYPAQQFQAQSFVHLGDIHLWKIRHQQWERITSVCSWKSYMAWFGSIFSDGRRAGNSTFGKPLGEIDARETYF